MGKSHTAPPLAKWLRQIRINLDMQQEDFAQRIGSSRGLVSLMERGQRTITPETIAAVRDAFPTAPAAPTGPEVDVLGPTLGEDRIGLIRYVGVVPCSSDWGDPLEAQDMRPIDNKFVAKNRFMARVVGNSCWPALKQGDMTVWESDLAPPSGLIVLAQRSEDQACTVKQLIEGPDGQPTLKAINPNSTVPTLEDGFSVVARLIGVIRNDDGESTIYKPAGIRPESLIDNSLLLAAERRAEHGSK